VLVHAQAIVEQHDGELERVHKHEACVGPRHEPSRREEDPSADRRGEVRAQHQHNAGRRQDAQRTAFGHQRPADRLRVGADEGGNPLVDPVKVGDDVQEGHRHAVPAQHVVARNLVDLRAEEADDRRRHRWGA
jgi:hypothetical protein